MVNLEKLLATVGGIPFSAMRKRSKSHKRTKRGKAAKSKAAKGKATKRARLSMMKRKKRKRKITAANRGRSAPALRVPPKGVIIRRDGKLYKSNGKKMMLLKN